MVVSAHSAASEECRRELEHALVLGKRIVPVLLADTADASEELASRQYVDMRDGVGEGAALTELVAAIATDLDWVKGHTHWLQAALRWEAADRDRGLLLRGSDLRAAEGWLVDQGARSEPRPTASQVTFIQASRRGTTRRLQLTIGAAALAVAVAAAFAGWALWQRGVAQDQRDAATAGSLAQQANALLPTDPAESLALASRATALRPTPEALTARDEALIESHQCRRIDLAAAATGVEFAAADGTEVLTAGPGAAARVWDVNSAVQRLELPTVAGDVRSADIERRREPGRRRVRRRGPRSLGRDDGAGARGLPGRRTDGGAGRRGRLLAGGRPARGRRAGRRGGNRTCARRRAARKGTRVGRQLRSGWRSALGATPLAS